MYSRCLTDVRIINRYFSYYNIRSMFFWYTIARTQTYKNFNNWWWEYFTSVGLYSIIYFIVDMAIELYRVLSID